LHHYTIKCKGHTRQFKAEEHSRIPREHRRGSIKVRQRSRACI
jgi:hypothetical protein